MKHQDSKQIIPVIATGRGWMAVEKPSGVSVHNDKDSACVVLSKELKKNKELKADMGYDPGVGLHPVHRLDRDTSGILLLACDPDIFRFFSLQFEGRQVKKTYVAIVHGHLASSDAIEKSGRWTWPLSPNAAGRTDPAGKKNRQPSETRYTVIDHSEHYTLIQCFPLTGRTHQIRRHAKLAGHPVVGDRRYGSKRSVQYLESRCGFTRLGLHAMAITVRLPDAPSETQLSSSGIPRDMDRLFRDDQKETDG